MEDKEMRRYCVSEHNYAVKLKRLVRDFNDFVNKVLMQFSICVLIKCCVTTKQENYFKRKHVFIINKGNIG